LVTLSYVHELQRVLNLFQITQYNAPKPPAKCQLEPSSAASFPNIRQFSRIDHVTRICIRLNFKIHISARPGERFSRFFFLYCYCKSSVPRANQLDRVIMRSTLQMCEIASYCHYAKLFEFIQQSLIIRPMLACL
jgi:hypothetical protein